MILIFGFGYVAQHFTSRIPGNIDICATSRGTSKRDSKVKIVDFSMEELKPLLDEVEYIIDSTPIEGQRSPVISLFGELIASYCQQLKWACYLSTTGVYGDLAGGVATEETQPNPSNERSYARLRAEQEWQILANKLKIPLTTLRLSGIYGPGRSLTQRLQKGSVQNIYMPNHYFSRIHVADIVTCLQLALEKKSNEIYNLADDTPAPFYEVLEFAAKSAGLEAPNRVSLTNSNASSRTREFFADNKKVSNLKVKRHLGLELQYASYKDYYSAGK